MTRHNATEVWQGIGGSIAGSGLPPDLRRGLDSEFQLGPHLIAGERVPFDGGGEPALRRQAQAFEKHVPAGLIHPALRRPAAARECAMLTR